jgi:hypothetical protein
MTITSPAITLQVREDNEVSEPYRVITCRHYEAYLPIGRVAVALFARLSCYNLAVPGTRRQQNGRSPGQNSTARHYPAVAGRKTADS